MESIHWFLLRNVCYNPQESSLVLFAEPENVDDDHLSHLQSFLPISLKSPSELSTFTPQSVETENVWGWFVSSDLEGTIQQRILLHSIFAHPDFFPPVPISRGSQVDERIFHFVDFPRETHKTETNTAGKERFVEFDRIRQSTHSIFGSKRRKRIEFQSNSIDSIPSSFPHLFLLFGSTFPPFSS